eukprot:783661-Amphidinium_carterae.1
MSHTFGAVPIAGAGFGCTATGGLLLLNVTCADLPTLQPVGSRLEGVRSARDLPAPAQSLERDQEGSMDSGMDIENPHLDPVENFSYLRLISADGHEFLMDRRVAYECDTFKKMVEQDGFKEGMTSEIKLPTITGKLLEKVASPEIYSKPLHTLPHAHTSKKLEHVIEYLYYKYKYTDAKVSIPELPIDDENVLDLLLVANYLNL